MGFKSFQLNLKLTEVGYQKVMDLNGSPVGLKTIVLGQGNSSGNKGYDVYFKDDHKKLAHEVVRKQIDSHQKESYKDEHGNQLARIDFAAIFSGTERFDVWEMGFLDEEDNLIYIWSSPDIDFAPKRTNVHLIISISQHLLFEEEADRITVKDAGLPFELFLQPLKDDFTLSILKSLATTLVAVGNLSAAQIEEVIHADKLEQKIDALESHHDKETQALKHLNKQLTLSAKQENDNQLLFNATVFVAIGKLSTAIINGEIND